VGCPEQEKRRFKKREKGTETPLSVGVGVGEERKNNLRVGEGEKKRGKVRVPHFQLKQKDRQVIPERVQ